MYKGEKAENLIKILQSTWVYIGFVELSLFSNVVPAVFSAYPQAHQWCLDSNEKFLMAAGIATHITFC